jgi:hypothetical protein
MTMLWSYDETTGTYQLGNITPIEVGTLCASVIAGFALTTSDTLGAEAARRNLLNYIKDMGDPQANRMMEVVIAADTHRIHKSNRRALSRQIEDEDDARRKR